MWWILAVALALPVDPVLVASCDAAKQADDPIALESCIKTWLERDPKSPYTDYYGYFLAVHRGDAHTAQSCFNRAVTQDLPEEREAELLHLKMPTTFMQRLGRWIPVIGVVISVLLIAVVRLWYAMGTDTPETT